MCQRDRHSEYTDTVSTYYTHTSTHLLQHKRRTSGSRARTAWHACDTACAPPGRSVWLLLLPSPAPAPAPLLLLLLLVVVRGRRACTAAHLASTDRNRQQWRSSDVNCVVVHTSGRSRLMQLCVWEQRWKGVSRKEGREGEKEKENENENENENEKERHTRT